MKLSNRNAWLLNHYSQYQYTNEVKTYFELFTRLIFNVEISFESIIEYQFNEIHSYLYLFWLSNKQCLFIRKQKDYDDWIWYVSIENENENIVLYSTSKYYISSRNWSEKIKWDKKPLNNKEEQQYILAFKQLFNSYEIIKNNYYDYVKNLTKKVSYSRREGVILRKDYIEFNRKLPSEYQDAVSAWLDSEESKKLIKKCLKYLDTPIRPFKTIVTKDFFEACKIYYQANPDNFNKTTFYKYETNNKYKSRILPIDASAKDWYFNYADGRDNGFMEVDEDSYEDYLQWAENKGKYKFNGNHPWEIERGWSVSLDTHLYIENVEDIFRTSEIDVGYCFILSFHPFIVPSLVRGFVSLRENGFPVEFHQKEKLKLLLNKEDYIGIKEAFSDIVHGGGFEWTKESDKKIFDYRHLPSHNQRQIIKKIIWKPLKYNIKIIDER